MTKLSGVIAIAAIVIVSATSACYRALSGPERPPRNELEDKHPAYPYQGEWFIQPDWHSTLAGRFSFEDGRAAPGVVYSLVWIDHPPDAACWWNPRGSDPQGRFSVRRLPTGRFEIEVYPPHEPGDTDVAAAIEGPFAAGDTNVVVTVRPGRSVLGRVVTDDGADVPGAMIEIGPRRDSGLATIREIQSDEDGTFEALHAAHGPIFIRVDARDVGRARRERLVADIGPVDPGAEPFTIVLGRGLVIGGRLVDADGRPKSGVCLVAVPVEEEVPFRYGTAWNGCRTDEEGRFTIRGLAAGRYQVWVRPWDHEIVMFRLTGSSSHALDGEAGTVAGATDLRLSWTE